MTIQLGIIGFPIGHSLSPVFQQAALDHLKLDAIYSTWEIDPGDLGSFIDGLRSPDIQGINVTIPFKKSVVHFLSYLFGTLVNNIFYNIFHIHAFIKSRRHSC